ncbi:MAG: tetratricopeptide repeat protein, partial [Candidatus Eremiobacterota bacterium]
YDEALKAFNNCLLYDPLNVEAYYNSGFIYYERKDYIKAEENLKIAVSKNPSHGDSHLYLGNTYYKKDMFFQALDRYKSAIKLKPDCAIAYSNMGAVFNNLEMLEEAENCYLKALEIDPALSEAHLNLGILYQKEGKYDRAIKEMNMYIASSGGQDVEEVKKKIKNMQKHPSMNPQSYDRKI